MTASHDNPDPTPEKSPLPLRYSLIALALLVVGVGTYLGFRFGFSNSNPVATIEAPVPPTPTTSEPSSTSTTFPSTTTTSPGTTTEPGTGTEPGTPTTTSPEAVVQEYFDALNASDYLRAWQLGGRNLSGNYSSFVEGFATTLYNRLTDIRSQGNRVYVTLEATQTSGEVRTFQGSYTVSNGVIVSANVSRVLAYSPYL